MSDILKFFELGRRIFVICPDCSDLFRLSDCQLHLKRKRKEDWLDAIDREMERLDGLEQRIEEQRAELKEQASVRGRNTALRRVRQIDKIFTPLKLNPDDAKTMMHPVDYVVFDGLTTDGNEVDRVVLLDNHQAPPQRKAVQKSIAEAVRRRRYGWQTLRVSDEGEVTVEE